LAAVEFAVLHAPEDELRAVALDAEVCGHAQGRDSTVPRRGAAGREKRGDRVAEKQHVDPALRGARDERVVLRPPRILRPRTRRRDPGSAGAGRGERRRTRRKIGGIHIAALTVVRLYMPESGALQLRADAH